MTDLLDPSLDWIFLPTPRLRPEIAWSGHVPFAHWVVYSARPLSLVELGTHSGVSYSAFCEAVKVWCPFTSCWAVDTWRGDDQAGNYGENVFRDFSAFHDAHYAGFSTLMRMTFDEALPHFEDGSVDLLHIDGFHSYDAVSHDFETWLPKLSRRGVVLFHDTAERQPSFGVWRFWAELRERYPGFEFTHSHGLGVLQVGPEAPAPIAALCAETDPGRIEQIRYRFHFLGEQVEMRSHAMLARKGIVLVPAGQTAQAV